MTATEPTYFIHHLTPEEESDLNWSEFNEEQDWDWSVQNINHHLIQIMENYV